MLVELGLGLTESIIFYLNEQLAELQGDGILDNIIGSFVTISCGSGSWLSLNPFFFFFRYCRFRYVWDVGGAGSVKRVKPITSFHPYDKLF